ncbi:MAG: hypothetical protein DME55_11875 [Verrucomicrobia bacterium]|nr:MAG: hypothetical protein DME55_11875 [Verrucomicrobiota bacterium]
MRLTPRDFWISSRTKRFLFTRLLAQSGLDRSLQYAIAQVVSNIVLVVGIFIVLENTGIHLAALTVFAGAVGVGVGFGLQNIASNFISGLVILAERPITIGDRVEVAGIAGQVEHIRARSTVIRTNDNIMMIVPNTKFIDSPVTNWTYGDRRVRFRIPVGVAYGSDVAKVRDLLLAVAHEDPHTLKEPAPGVFLEQFAENSIDFKLVVWSSEMSARPSRYRSDLNFAIEKKLREARIEFPFPQRDPNRRRLDRTRYRINQFGGGNWLLEKGKGAQLERLRFDLRTAKCRDNNDWQFGQRAGKRQNAAPTERWHPQVSNDQVKSWFRLRKCRYNRSWIRESGDSHAFFGKHFHHCPEHPRIVINNQNRFVPQVLHNLFR